MTEIKSQIIEVGRILKEYDLDIYQDADTQKFDLVDKNDNNVLVEITDFNELHAVLQGFEEGYKAAVKFYNVVKY